MLDKFQQSFPILLILLGIIFTVTISENIQITNALSMSAERLVYELDVGETQLRHWTVINDKDEPIKLEFYAKGKGSEFLIFEKFVDVEAKGILSHEIFLSIPDDHPDNVQYNVKLFALLKGEKPEGGAASGAIVNVQVLTEPIIKIGANPVYTPEHSPIVIEEEKTIVEESIIEMDSEEAIVEEIGETMEEKLARIEAANKESTIIKEDVLKTTPQVLDEGYEPEPVMDPEPVMNSEPVMENSVQEKEGGGCLIATAAYGTELAPQVQLLREIRDYTVLNTGVGTYFMTGFNQLYYSFSPTIADYEREYPLFKDTVRTFITPMIYSLSILTLVEEGNDAQMLGFGIFIISLNLGLYIFSPAITVYAISKRLRN